MTGGHGGSASYGGGGGGIFNDNGVVILRESAVYGNTTGNGGPGGAGGYGSSYGGWGGEGGEGGNGAGILNNGMLTVVNTTITDNATGNGGPGGAGGPGANPADAGYPGAPGQGGHGAGIYQLNGQATIQESTVAANVDGTGLQGEGATPSADGIEVVAGELTEVDTIVSQDDCHAYPGGQIKDGLAAGDGHLNLTWPTTSCPGIVANPLLGLLAENGGPTPTMAIGLGSPALDRILPIASAGCTQADQRGVPRPQPVYGRCDIGAYEYQR